MKGFLKFFALVLLLVPVWIGVLTVTGEDRLKHRPSLGPLVALDRALPEAGDGLWVSRTTAMTPLDAAEAWRLEGLVTGSEGQDDAAALPFAATLHTKCLPYADPACWMVDQLDYPAEAATDVAAASDAAATPSYRADKPEPERLSIVQDQLRELGFDPGPSDGVLGFKTQQAVGAYLDRTKENGTDVPKADALVELEVMGRLARAAGHHAEGDYRAALDDYATVIALDPANARAYFNRGLIYQHMGLPALAIANYDRALSLHENHVVAYRSRGNARFDTGDYWGAFADHADALGVQYIGDEYLLVRDRLGEVRSQLAPGFAAVLNWAVGAWDQAKHTVAETLRRSDGAGEEEST